MPVTRIPMSWDVQADVTLEDGTSHRVGPFGPRDLIAAERQFGLPSDLIRQMPRLEHVAFCSWLTLQRRGVLPDKMTFDAFVERLSDVVAEVETPEEPKRKDEEEPEAEEPGLATALSPNGSP